MRISATIFHRRIKIIARADCGKVCEYGLKANNINFSLMFIWTVHHLDSWIKIDQLDVTCFIISLFNAQHVSNVSTSIFSSLRLIVGLFHVLYCSGSMCVGVMVWFGWGGVVSLCRLKPVNSEIIKQVTPSWSIFIQLTKYMFQLQWFIHIHIHTNLGCRYVKRNFKKSYRITVIYNSDWKLKNYLSNISAFCRNYKGKM